MSSNCLIRSVGSFLVVLLFGISFHSCWKVGTAEGGETKLIAGFPEEEALKLGERMYREGILPSGEPMRAIVQKDIAMDGTMFTCESCHLRSGLGSLEGDVVVLPTNGADLYRPFFRGSEKVRPIREKLPSHFRVGDRRPAYTDETLARALRGGRDPAGRKFNHVMPRYILQDRDMEIMVHYLKNLTVEISPGVTDTTISFATVVTEDVSREERESMLGVLRTYIEARNSQTRQQERRARKGPFYRLEWYTAYRRLELDVWELSGSPDTWRSQLESRYREKPVFALIGGISTQDWRPIHRFCEENTIPCIFPITDYPVVSDSDWYTLYFSKGLYQEGEAVARYLRGMAEIPADPHIVQVFRDNPAARALAEGFQKTREELGQPLPENREVEPDELLDKDFWKNLTGKGTSSVLILWLGFEDLAAIGKLATAEKRPAMIFLSSSLLGGGLYSLTDGVREFTYITYPYRLPEKGKGKKIVAEVWLKSRKIPVTNIKIQAKTYFLGYMLSGALMDMTRDYYRDRFLEGIDMMIDQRNSIGIYSNLSFGPGQRYASKGCYIVQLTEGPEPELVRKSDWVIH